MKFLVSTVIFLSVSSSAIAATGTLGIFRLNAVLVNQTQGQGTSFTVEPSWAPELDFKSWFVRSELGAKLLKSALGKLFLAFHYEAFAGIPLSRTFKIELGGGFETWTGGIGGTHPKASVNLMIPVRKYLNDIHVGYSRYFLDTGVNQFKAGISFFF